MTLRPATLDDIPEVASLFIDTRIRCLSFIVWDYSQEIMERVFAQAMTEAEMWLSGVDGEITGFIVFTPDEVEHLYVRPEHHGRGIGKALLAKALAEAPEDVRLWVFQANTEARRFYERNGFTLEFETDGEQNMERTPDARYVYRKGA